jgi:hypothetical protein
MPIKKLPPYFKEYLDEKFSHVVGEVTSVKAETVKINAHLTVLNGTVADLVQTKNKNQHIQKEKLAEFEKVKKKVSSNRNKIRYIVFAMILGSLVWVKESRDLFLSLIMQFIGG